MTAWVFGVVDKQTGSGFDLRMTGPTRAACATDLFDLGFIVGPCRDAPPPRADPVYRERRRFLLDCPEYRDDPYLIPQGAVWRACCSGDEQLDTMLEALAWESHAVHRHFLLQSIVRAAYVVGSPKGRSVVKAASRTRPEDAWRLVEPYGWQWVTERARFRPHLWLDPALPAVGRNLCGCSVLADLRKHLTQRGFKSRAGEVASLETAFYGEGDWIAPGIFP